MHDDQVSQDERAMAAEIHRSWEDFTDPEKAAALASLAKFMDGNPRWTEEAGATALLRSMRMSMEMRADSPIAWGDLSRQDLDRRLMEVAAWDDQTRGDSPPYLRDACLDVAEQLRRERPHGRDTRDR